MIFAWLVSRKSSQVTAIRKGQKEGGGGEGGVRRQRLGRRIGLELCVM